MLRLYIVLAFIALFCTGFAINAFVRNCCWFGSCLEKETFASSRYSGNGSLPSSLIGSICVVIFAYLETRGIVEKLLLYVISSDGIAKQLRTTAITASRIAIP